jgi:hypothetical protein
LTKEAVQASPAMFKQLKEFSCNKRSSLRSRTPAIQKLQTGDKQWCSKTSRDRDPSLSLSLSLSMGLGKSVDGWSLQ